MVRISASSVPTSARKPDNASRVRTLIRVANPGKSPGGLVAPAAPPPSTSAKPLTCPAKTIGLRLASCFTNCDNALFCRLHLVGRCPTRQSLPHPPGGEMLVSARALTVLVIAHNDAQNLLGTVERIYSALTVTVEEFRIVIFDDGSTDDTAAAAKQACGKCPFVVMHRNNPRIGLGYCMIAGSREASTPYVVYAPADNTWPLRSFIV